jgi:hypothetical protein
MSQTIRSGRRALQRFVEGQAQPLGRAGRQVLHHHVGLVDDQPLQQRRAAGA